MVDSTGLIMLAIWPVCELPVWKLNIQSHILTQATVWGKFFCFTFSIFVLFQNVCYVILFSLNNGSPLLHWVQTIFHQNYWQKVHIFRKQALCRFCIWNCELIIQDVKKIYIWKKRKGTQNSTAFISGGGGEFVFRDGYHAWVWPLKFKIDPKLRFWVDSKSHSKQGFRQFFHTLGLKLGFFLNSAKYHTLIKDMGSKSYLNPVFIVGKKHTLISYFYKPEKTYPFFLIFAVFDTLN